MAKGEGRDAAYPVYENVAFINCIAPPPLSPVKLRNNDKALWRIRGKKCFLKTRLDNGGKPERGKPEAAHLGIATCGVEVI